jgi:signal transduction histidine kinase
MLLCQVKDSGIGIPMNRIHTVFDRFTQIHDNLNRSFEGSGLGLAISRAYVEMLRGSIEVYSEVGKGSEFKVRIPV